MTSSINAPQGHTVEGAQHWPEPPLLAPINVYCRQRIPGFQDFVAITPIGEGFSNPTYRVENARGEIQVLRAMPPRRSVTTAHRIDREYRVMSALQGSAVPVPRLIHYCEDTAPAGTPFYLMEYVAGPVFTGGTLPDNPAARRRIIVALADCLGCLHTVDYRARGLGKFGARSGRGYIERQVATMTRLYRDTEMGRSLEMESLIALLTTFSPESSEPCLVHGDYRLGNVVVDPDLQGIAAVLDWELSTIGDPLTDLAYCLLMYRWGSANFGAVVRDAEGVPSEAEFVSTYCQAAGRSSLPDLALYQAFSLFRLACITQAALHREAAGHALRRALSPEQYPAAIARTALDLAESGEYKGTH